jgi:hypothetical protein
LDGDWLRSGYVRIVPVLTICLLISSSPDLVRASDPYEIEREEFELVWKRTEAPVANGDTQRSWLWGPEPRTGGMQERYLDSPGEQRTVQYFDKGRMEVNDPTANPNDPWFVTSGLLTRELISGEIQIGDDAFLDTGEGAGIQVAGDHLNPFPQYRHLDEVVDQGNPDRTGELADKVLTPDGLDSQATPPQDTRAEFAHYVTYHGPEGFDVGYNIPAAFWDYLNAPGTIYDSNGNAASASPLFSWIFVMGFPISDPFWAEVPVRETLQWVLIQPFERRVLTYTPSNSPEWQVEMGNIGQHYRDWRSQYFPEAASGGDPDYFGINNSAVWRYGNNIGVNEIWEAAGMIDSFIPGSNVYARDEYRVNGFRTTYWAPGDDGLYLHGYDVRDGQNNLIDMVVYAPAIRVMAAEWDFMEIETESTALSLLHPPETQNLVFDMRTRQLVSTPAGQFQTWRIETTDFDEAGVAHQLGEVFWFEPEIGIVQWVDSENAFWLVDSSVLD